MNTNRLFIRVSDEDKARILQYAKDQDVTVSWLVLSALSRQIDGLTPLKRRYYFNHESFNESIERYRKYVQENRL